MDPKESLDTRGESVLLSVIEEYIHKGEPVGSLSLSKKQPLSPATLRSVMADLEDKGYLYQPHPSAGRVPTDRGYRFFVDQLLRPSSVLAEAETLLEGFESPSTRPNLKEVLEDACGILSQNSHQAGLVMLPSFSSMVFKNIDFIKVDPNQALAVFFSEIGVLQNKIIPVEFGTTQEELTSISRFLNEQFSGHSIRWIRQELMNRMQNEHEHYNRLMQKAMELSSQLFDEEDHPNLLVEGALNLFDPPEFAVDMKQIRTLLRTLEEKTKLIKLLDLCLEQEGTTVLIGGENQNEEMHNCSLIAKNYKLREKNIGTLAIFGPKRMDYKKAISIVNQTAKNVSNLLSS